MRMICRVAAEFTTPTGEKVFEVKPWDRLVILDAPDSVRDTLLFKWLMNDGKIDLVETAADQKKLENDPIQGAAPDGSRKRQKRGSKAAKEKDEAEPTEITEEPTEAKSEPETGDAL